MENPLPQNKVSSGDESKPAQKTLTSHNNKTLLLHLENKKN